MLSATGATISSSFLVRIVFCLFADDTGIFEPRDIFLDFIETRTERGRRRPRERKLAQLFQVLDTPEADRLTSLDEDLARSSPTSTARCSRGRSASPPSTPPCAPHCWTPAASTGPSLSPAIFGALFQSVMEPAERRAKGAHYTTEKNILKVIEPLFMDDLRAEFGRLKSRKDGRRRPALLAFQEKLGQLRFFDPACGCGNFLIIAYRELRTLEIEVLKEIYAGGLFDKLGESLSVIDVDQFYGIEIGEFPARIAETALWMMDHIMNNRLSLAFGQAYARIPLETSPTYRPRRRAGDRLGGPSAAEECSFVFGNPPFVGAKFQTAEQRAQVRRIAALGKTGGTLDYVTAWFITAGEYVKTSQARIGFVATNSITQGEQVAQLWPVLFNRCKLEIAFAHRTFAWGRTRAARLMCMWSFSASTDGRPRGWKAPVQLSRHQRRARGNDALPPSRPTCSARADLPIPHLTVREEGRPINGMGTVDHRLQPIDNGHYIFDSGGTRGISGR